MQEPLVKMPRTQRGRETLNKILSAAAQVFYSKGYGAANVNDIAALAGVATGTVYIYFDGKYNLYKYLLLQCSHQIRRHLSVSVAGCTTRREVERVGLKSWLEYIRENQYVYNLIWESLYVDRELFFGYYDAFCASYVRGLKLAQGKGEVTDIDPEVLAYSLMGATSFLGMRWGLFGGDVDLDYVTDEFMKLMDLGLFAGRAAFVPERPKVTKAAANDLMFNVEIDDDFAVEFEK